MVVRAKLKCSGITKRVHWSKPGEFIYHAEFGVVSGDTEENKRFFEATPGGKLELGTLRDDFFEVGKTYYIDITEAID